MIDRLAVAAGAVGYRSLEGLSWLDAMVNAAMIMTGNDPMNALKAPGGRLFAAADALIGEAVYVLVVTVRLTPVRAPPAALLPQEGPGTRQAIEPQFKNDGHQAACGPNIGEQQMDNEPQDTTSMEHHSRKPQNLVIALVGVLGGAALFAAVMVWYFTTVDTAEFHRFKGGKAGAKDSDALLLDTDVLEIVPISEMHVKIKSGLVEGVELPKSAGLTAKVEGDDVTISAAKDAKEGTHQITVRGSKGKKATIHVHFKAANPVTGPQTSERH